MKQLMLLFLFLSPLLMEAQEIKSNVTDGFTNEHTIETTLVSLKAGFSTGFGVSYSSVNTSYYLNIIGYGKGGAAITENDSLWFVLSNGAIAKLNSPIELAGEESTFQNMYLYHYYITLDMIEAIKDHPAVMVRIVSGNEHTDISIPKKSGKSFAKLSAIFLAEVSK